MIGRSRLPLLLCATCALASALAAEAQVAALASALAAEAQPSFSPSTTAIWAPASPNYALFRPKTLELGGAPAASMRVIVSAAPDSQGRLLGLYKLFINGVFVAVGPGRPDHNGVEREAAEAAVSDTIDVPAAVLAAGADGGRSVSVALQCLNQNSSKTAWVMLEAVINGADGQQLAHLATDGDWHAYDADEIFKPGIPETGSHLPFVNEDIDGRAAQRVDGWRLPEFGDFSGWSKPVVRAPKSQPVPKTTLPLAVSSLQISFGALRTRSTTAPGGAAAAGSGGKGKIVQDSPVHYFFDLQQEMMGGVNLTVPAATAARWGGAGTRVEIRLGEMLSFSSPRRVLWPFGDGPSARFDEGNWNSKPQWTSSFTLATGDNNFEQHEYIGPWRYGELIIHNPQAADAGGDFDLSVWTARYPWNDSESSFASSSDMLDAVWRLCSNTLKYAVLDTFTDSNARERTPYEADAYCAAGSYWALQSQRALPRHTTSFLLNNPTWPTEWKQYSIMLVYGHYMQTGDLSLVSDATFELLRNNTMAPFIDADSDLVNFTSSALPADPTCRLAPTGFICNSPMCHSDAGGKSVCDNIDWLPKFRANHVYSNTSTIINAFAVRTMVMLSELAKATGRAQQADELAAQATRTRQSMLRLMWSADEKLWCDGICPDMFTPQWSVFDHLDWWAYNGTSFHAQHFLLSLGLTPPEGIPTAQQYLQQTGMAGSTYSANSLLRGLYDEAYWVDYGQTALDLMTQCGDHSWCHMLQAGATTTWEHWYELDGTHSHLWSASPAGAIANGLMGVRPTAPGWASWIVRPAPGNLTHASIRVPTPRGIIAANFSRNRLAAGSSGGGSSGGGGSSSGSSGGSSGSPSSPSSPSNPSSPSSPSSSKLTLQGIPQGTKGSICMPLFGAAAESAVITLDGVRIQKPRVDHGAYVCVDGVQQPTVVVEVTVATATATTATVVASTDSSDNDDDDDHSEEGRKEDLAITLAAATLRAEVEALKAKTARLEKEHCELQDQITKGAAALARTRAEAAARELAFPRGSPSAPSVISSTPAPPSIIQEFIGEIVSITDEAAAWGGKPPPIPRLNIDPAGISISGLSSGADFASNFAVAFSRSIMGVGVFAGQPPHCAVTYFPDANDTTFPAAASSSPVCATFCDGCPAGTAVQCDHCKRSHPDDPGKLFVDVNVSHLVQAVQRRAAAGLIDPVSNLRRTKAYSYCGTKDWHLAGTVKNAEFWDAVGATGLSAFNLSGGHAWPSDEGFKACGDERDQGFWAVENCGYDGPGELLKHVYGTARLNRSRADATVPGNLRLFDQLPFNPGGAVGADNVGLGERGLIYVPSQCAAGKQCLLHVSLHGCDNPWFLSLNQNAGALSFSRWAETNGIVVVFPHLADQGYNHTGPGAFARDAGDTCWDAYGKTGPSYDSKKAPQMMAVSKIIETVSGVRM